MAEARRRARERLAWSSSTRCRCSGRSRLAGDCTGGSAGPPANWMDMAAAHVDPALVLRRRALRRSRGPPPAGGALGVVAVAAARRPATGGSSTRRCFAGTRRWRSPARRRGVDALVRRAVARDVAGQSLLRVDTVVAGAAARAHALRAGRRGRPRVSQHPRGHVVMSSGRRCSCRAGKAGYIVSVDGRVLRAADDVRRTHCRGSCCRSARRRSPGTPVDADLCARALHVLRVPAAFQREHRPASRMSSRAGRARWRSSATGCRSGSGRRRARAQAAGRRAACSAGWAADPALRGVCRRLGARPPGHRLQEITLNLR